MGQVGRGWAVRLWSMHHGLWSVRVLLGVRVLEGESDFQNNKVVVVVLLYDPPVSDYR